MSAAILVHHPQAAAAASVLLWACALTVVAVGVLVRPSRRIGALPLVLVFSLALAAAAATHVALAEPHRVDSARLLLDAPGRVEITATVVGKVEPSAQGASFVARAESVTASDETRTLATDVVVALSHDDRAAIGPRLDVGATVRVIGAAAPARAGERAVVRLRALEVPEVLREPGGAFAVASALRHGLVRASAPLPAPGAGLIAGLAVGDTSAVSLELDEAMKATSLSHLTAVSGANCAIVVGIAFVASAALGASRRTRVVVGLAVLAGFVLLVTPEPSVVRAASMAAVSMLALLLGRPAAGIGILTLTVGVLLVVDPWLSASLGFALSAAATGALLLFARPLAEGLSRVLPRFLALALAVPLAAQLACGPLLILIVPEIPLWGVPANLLAAPAAPVATVVGLLACLAFPWPALQSLLTSIAWLPASWIAGTATVVATLPFGTVGWHEGILGAVSLGLVGACVGVIVAGSRGRTRRARLVRLVSTVVVAVVVGLVGGRVALDSVAGPWTLPRDWTVLACDVGQGDAVLIRSAGAVALIDTGPDPDLLSRCLTRAGVARIDLLVLTHFDIDHSGGVDAVRGRVGRVLHGPVDPTDATTLAALEAAGAQVTRTGRGDSGLLGAARWRTVWPGAGAGAGEPGNDASVVLEISGGGVPDSLWLGDLSAMTQRVLQASGALDPPYALVKVAHHGSADQDAGLYALAAPAIALIPVGAENTHGHPRPEILGILAELGAEVSRTDEAGMVAISPTAPGWRIWTERAPG
ncbi:ComEC/Rec2 family competence protein [Microbacterium chocolatum]|uniref:ComEC/Rec2 family competence protein n=1 Tax=Microbacterium aurantiacum TaxID=162393 RepID=UPI00338E09F4